VAIAMVRTTGHRAAMKATIITVGRRSIAATTARITDPMAPRFTIRRIRTISHTGIDRTTARIVRRITARASAPRMRTAVSQAIVITDIPVLAWALSTATVIGAMVVDAMIVADAMIATRTIDPITMSVETIKWVVLVRHRSAMVAIAATRNLGDPVMAMIHECLSAG